jgi:hypothetical protein
MAGNEIVPGAIVPPADKPAPIAVAQLRLAKVPHRLQIDVPPLDTGGNPFTRELRRNPTTGIAGCAFATRATPPRRRAACSVKTIGTVRVACSNGSIVEVPKVRMTSGASAANSVASPAGASPPKRCAPSCSLTPPPRLAGGAAVQSAMDRHWSTDHWHTPYGKEWASEEGSNTKFGPKRRPQADGLNLLRICKGTRWPSTSASTFCPLSSKIRSHGSRRGSPGGTGFKLHGCLGVK